MAALADPWAWHASSRLPENALTHAENSLAFCQTMADARFDARDDAVAHHRREADDFVVEFRRDMMPELQRALASETHVAPAPSAGPVAKRARTDA